IWLYEFEGVSLEKRIVFLYGQNTVHLHYRLLSNQEKVSLELRPWVHFRGHERPVNEGSDDNYRITATGGQYEVCCDNFLPRLRMVLEGDHSAFTYDGGTWREIHYQKEAERGYRARGSLWSPGNFSVSLHRRREATLIGSTEWWSTMLALTPEEAVGFDKTRHRRLIATGD